ncbi:MULTISPECIES: hypothetical protein [unclassified Cryobacterium]|uniref:hypothetical protein n=2 Tax=Cryobacterium TaxID=69578 RepID=UPI002AB5A3C7|nr:MULTISPECIES: hypothetical protein [unclassified Cryobacterium]MDY7541452.1 hypothetical protein [Cryobacterium sp. 5B3]MEA9999596.1 hypothetical protein [Cryobacterium sp. RTS3]MEB0274795.1 hypothetical protein [Cryobacterium sp. 5B3]
MAGPFRTSAPPHFLELRVHGINNTSPFALLDLPPDEVELAAGDVLGSFWTPTDYSLRRHRRAADAAEQRGYVPRRIRREAYSWGGLVRSTPGGDGPVWAVLAALARIGWALLLPFSIANAAAWCWRLPTQGVPRGLSVRAGIIRLFGVLLTLLLVATVANLGIDLLARQCYAGGALVCSGLPGALGGLAAWTAGQRMALFSLAPIAMILGIWQLSNGARLRYDVADRYLAARPAAAGPSVRPVDGRPGAPAASPAGPRPLLESPHLWNRRGETHRLSLAHLAAGLSLTSVLSCAALAGGAGGVSTGVSGTAAGVVFLVAGALLLAALVTAFCTRTLPVEPIARTAGARWHTALVLLAIVTHLAALLVLGLAPPAQGDDGAAGAGATQGAAAAVSSVSQVSSITLLALLGGMLACVAASAVFRYPAPRGRLRFEAWHGLAPAVFLTLALTVGLILSSLLTVGVGTWLNGGAGASALLGAPTNAAGSPATPVLTVPGVYPWFGGLAFALLAVAVLSVACSLIRPRRVGPRVAEWTPDDVPPGSGGDGRREASGVGDAAHPDSSGGAAAASTTGTAAAGAGAPGSGQPDGPGIPGGETPMPAGSEAELVALLRPVRDRKRALAARLHLVEPVTGIVAAAGFLALLATEILTVVVPRLLPADAAAPGSAPADGVTAPPGLLAWLDVSMAGWAGVAVIVLAGLVLRPTPGRATRPLAIVWDLACFLPRAGHPLGAPCYTERAVPEVCRRVLWWLDGRAEGTPPRRREVVLAAHSMGTVVAIAALFSLAAHPDWSARRDRVTLLSFGVQVRPYFGRFFPEILGPEVLGTQPCLRPRLWSADPWLADAGATPLPPEPASPAAALPVGRWISLWRATDPLGFPAWSNRAPGNPIDRFADEIDTSGYTGAVGTHGEYYRTRQYHDALADLAGTALPG